MKTTAPTLSPARDAAVAADAVDGIHGVTEPSPMQLRSTLAGFPTGIAVVTARVDGRAVGMSVNSFSSVSLEPPLVSLAFARTSTTWPLLQRAPRWGISLLSEESAHLMSRLARPSAERFAEVPLTDLHGAVVLEKALATFAVEPEREIDAGDHVLTLLRVLALRRDPDQHPLVFFGSTLRRLHRDV